MRMKTMRLSWHLFSVREITENRIKQERERGRERETEYCEAPRKEKRSAKRVHILDRSPSYPGNPVIPLAIRMCERKKNRIYPYMWVCVCMCVHIYTHTHVHTQSGCNKKEKDNTTRAKLTRILGGLFSSFLFHIFVSLLCRGERRTTTKITPSR